MADRVLTLPNALTGVRLLLMPLLAIFIEVGMGSTAFVILLVAALTDLFDGWAARKFKQESDLGKLMDPVADKVFLCVAIIFLMAREGYPSFVDPDPSLSPWLAVLLLSREFLVTGLRAMAASVGVVIAASQMGKIKTVFQFVGLGAITLGGEPYGLPLFLIGNFCLWISVILSYWSMVQYGFRVFIELKTRTK